MGCCGSTPVECDEFESVFDSLPTDLCIKIFSFLDDLESFASCTAVSTKWMRNVPFFFRRLNIAPCEWCYSTSVSTMQPILNKLTNLNEFYSIGRYFGMSEIESNQDQLINFQKLHPQLPIQVISTIIKSSLFSLTNISLICFDHLEDKHITDILPHISQSIRSIDISYCTRLTDKSLLAIAEQCSNLKELRIAYCRSMTQVGIEKVLSGVQVVHNIEQNDIQIQKDNDSNKTSNDILLLNDKSNQQQSYKTIGAQRFAVLDIRGIEQDQNTLITMMINKNDIKLLNSSNSNINNNENSQQQTDQIPQSISDVIHNHYSNTTSSSSYNNNNSSDQNNTNTKIFQLKRLPFISFFTQSHTVTSQSLSILCQRFIHLRVLVVAGCSQVDAAFLKSVVGTCKGIRVLDIAYCQGLKNPFDIIDAFDDMEFISRQERKKDKWNKRKNKKNNQFGLNLDNQKVDLNQFLVNDNYDDQDDESSDSDSDKENIYEYKSNNKAKTNFMNKETQNNQTVGQIANQENDPHFEISPFMHFTPSEHPKLPQLRKLRLDGNYSSITDSSINTVVRNCPSLKALSMSKCGNWVTDASLYYISEGLKDLRVLDLRELNKIGINGIKQLAGKYGQAMEEQEIEQEKEKDINLNQIQQQSSLQQSQQQSQLLPIPSKLQILLLDLCNPRIDGSSLLYTAKYCPSLFFISFSLIGESKHKTKVHEEVRMGKKITDQNNKEKDLNQQQDEDKLNDNLNDAEFNKSLSSENVGKLQQILQLRAKEHISPLGALRHTARIPFWALGISNQQLQIEQRRRKEMVNKMNEINEQQLIQMEEIDQNEKKNENLILNSDYNWITGGLGIGVNNNNRERNNGVNVMLQCLIDEIVYFDDDSGTNSSQQKKQSQNNNTNYLNNEYEYEQFERQQWLCEIREENQQSEKEDREEIQAVIQLQQKKHELSELEKQKDQERKEFMSTPERSEERRKLWDVGFGEDGISFSMRNRIKEIENEIQILERSEIIQKRDNYMKIVEEYVKEKQKQDNENKKKNNKDQKNDESLKQQENQCDEEGAYIWEDDYNDIHNWQRGGSASMKGISYHFDACILGEVFQR